MTSKPYVVREFTSDDRHQIQYHHVWSNQHTSKMIPEGEGWVINVQGREFFVIKDHRNDPYVYQYFCYYLKNGKLQQPPHIAFDSVNGINFTAAIKDWKLKKSLNTDTVKTLEELIEDL
jgi:hypothetical protein